MRVLAVGEGAISGQVPSLVATETSTCMTKAISFYWGEFGDRIQLHGNRSPWGAVPIVLTGAGVSVGGSEGDSVHSFGKGFRSSQGGWLLHGNKGSDTFLQPSLIIVHSSCIIHVREFQHQSPELMVVGIDRGLLREALEAVIGIDAGVHRNEMVTECGEEPIPVRGSISPIDALVIVSPP